MSDLPLQMQELLAHLKSYRDIYSYQQTPEEKAEVRLIGEQVRALRRKAKFTRMGLKMKLGIDVALITAVENGIGDKETAEYVLQAVKILAGNKNKK